jgi:DNA-binding NtrC family response regulator
MDDHRTYNNKALQQNFSDDRNEADGRPSLADVLIVSGDERLVAYIGKMLNDNLYGTSVALNGDQVIERLKDTWHHLVLIDLDSIDVSEDYLAINIRKIEPDIPIIGLGSHASGSCPDITYLKKPLTVEKIKNIFPKK